MLLRESGRAKDTVYELAALTDPTVESGVEAEDVLLAFSDGVAGGGGLEDARAALEARLGGRAVVEASVIAANFSMLDRVANAIGIPLDGPFEQATRAFRGAIGIDAFLSAANTPI